MENASVNEINVVPSNATKLQLNSNSANTLVTMGARPTTALASFMLNDCGFPTSSAGQISLKDSPGDKEITVKQQPTTASTALGQFR